MQFKETLNRLTRSQTDRVLGGVCAGFADATDTPAWIWRAGFVIAALGFGTGLLLYAVLWIFMPAGDRPR
jgi:phage shock protein PspC (stress-responsive transcriptional regulator)